MLFLSVIGVKALKSQDKIRSKNVMAALNNAFLSIQMLNSQTASVVVNVDFLFAFDTQFFGPFDTNASNRFQREVSRSILDEDRVGADDIVAELTLTLGNTTKIRKRTNVVSV
jgi:hypothetical protein